MIRWHMLGLFHLDGKLQVTLQAHPCAHMMIYDTVARQRTCLSRIEAVLGYLHGIVLLSASTLSFMASFVFVA